MTGTTRSLAPGGPDAAARAWLLCGLLGLVATVVLGAYCGGLLAFGYALPAGDALQFGRLRPVHTRLAIHLWLIPTALGILRARLAGGLRATLVERVAPWAHGAVQVAACSWIVAVGIDGPAYAEAPAVFDVLSASLVAVGAWPWLLRDRARAGHERTGVAYARTFVIWSVLLVVLVHVVGPLLEPTGRPALHRLWLATTIGLQITPAVAAIVYVTLPSVTGGTSRRPLVGRVGFLTLAATYVFAGGRHALHGPQPAWLATIGWISSVAIVVPAACLAWNVLDTVWRGRAASRAERSAAAWLFLGAALWCLAAFQGAAQSLPSVNAAVSKTDFVAGHAHLAFFGAVGAWAVGATVALLGEARPDVDRRVPGGAWMRWTWAASAVGMSAVLVLRGVGEAAADLDAVPFATRFGAIQGLWHVRLSFGLLIVVAVALWAGRAAWHLVRLPSAADAVSAGASRTVVRPVLAGVVWWVAGLAAVLAAAPRRDAPPSEPSRGRIVYEREGCVQCHTLAVRRTETDRLLYGAPTPLEHLDGPPGTRRIGPDLAHVGDRRSAGWLRAHLVAPSRRDDTVGHDGVRKTAMPSFAHLAPEDLDALVAWLTSRRAVPK